VIAGHRRSGRDDPRDPSAIGQQIDQATGRRSVAADGRIGARIADEQTRGETPFPSSLRTVNNGPRGSHPESHGPGEVAGAAGCGARAGQPMRNTTAIVTDTSVDPAWTGVETSLLAGAPIAP